MPSIGKKRPSRGRGGASNGVTTHKLNGVKTHVLDSALIPSTSQGKATTSASLRGRTRTTTKPPATPARPRKHGIICAHTAKALQENAHEVYKEVLELFVVPSSKCLIPWDPRRSRLLFGCQFNQCALGFQFVCCHCKAKFCRDHTKEHALLLKHGCAVNVEVGYAACFCCGELLVQMDKCTKIWREHRLSAVYETALRHGWLPDVTQLDCFLPDELREACVDRSVLVGVHGIVNLSNTCCLSVILQTFGHTPLFRDYCLSRLHRCNPTALRFDQECVMCAFTSVIFDLYILPAGQCYAPQMVFQAVQNSLCKHGSELGEQEDPAEILNLLLTDMHLRTEKDGRKISPALCQKLNLYERETASLCVDHAVYCPCIICDLFSGVEEFTTTCPLCKQDRVQGNSFKLLMLPIREDEPATSDQAFKPGDLGLEDCLKMYTATHFTSECKNDCCVDVRGADRTNRFRHLPVVLIIQLKRAVAKVAKAKARDGDFKKNRDHIQFPLSLDMSPYMAPGASGSTRYVLYAVIVHKGTKLSSGHYVCYFKHMNGMWLSMDDRAIFCFSEAHVLALQAYMLFYVHETVEFTVNPGAPDLSKSAKDLSSPTSNHFPDTYHPLASFPSSPTRPPSAATLFSPVNASHVANDHTYSKSAGR